MPSLWRNNVLLGQIVDPPEKKIGVEPGALAGLLERTPAFTGIEPMMQHRVLILPGKPVFQSTMERVDLGPRSETADLPRSKKLRKELRPMGAEEARGVSADKLLEIRDDEGKQLDFDAITLSCHVIPDDVPKEELQKHWGPGAHPGEIWLVFAHSHRARVE